MPRKPKGTGEGIFKYSGPLQALAERGVVIIGQGQSEAKEANGDWLRHFKGSWAPQGPGQGRDGGTGQG